MRTTTALALGATLGIGATLGALRIAIQRGLIVDQLVAQVDRRRRQAEADQARYAASVVP